MDRKTFIKSIAVIGASPAFAAGVPLKDADGKNKTKSESFGGGFVPSARIFKTGRAKLTLRPPEKYAGKLSSLSVSILYGDAAWDGKSDSFPWARDFPAKYREENGAFAIDADFKKECRYTFVVKDKKRGGNEASSLPSPSTRLGRTSTRLGRSKVTATYTPQIRTGKTRRRKSPCAATKSGSTTRQYPTTASIPLPRT